MKTGKIAIMTGVDQPFEIREYPVTEPQPGMAQMGLIASGICGTDVHIHRGKIPVGLPAGIGHEFVGKVLSIHDEDSKQSGITVGTNVIVDIACPCGECVLCEHGDDANCLHMGVTNGGNPDVAPHFYGGYGEYNYSPVANLIPIPESLDPTMTCVFACAGPTATHAFELAKKAGENLSDVKVAVVQGLGPVGCYAVMYLAALGIQNVVAVVADHNKERVALAKELGATHVFNLLEQDVHSVTAAIRDLNNGIGADLVFEASGAPVAVPQGLAMLRNRGVYLIPGQYSNSGGIEIQPQMITFNALHIIGSSQYSVCDVKKYLQFLLDNPQLHAPIAKMANQYTIDQINEAFDDAKARTNIKTMLVAQSVQNS